MNIKEMVMLLQALVGKASRLLIFSKHRNTGMFLG
jgi:hypothetical protein